MRNFLAAVAVLVCWPLARAAAAGDIVLLPQGEASQQRELADVRAEVADLLRASGRSVVVNPAAAFELRHSREARGLDAEQLRAWTDEMIKWRDRRKHQRVAHLASMIAAAAEHAPELSGRQAADFVAGPSYAVMEACFEGLLAYKELHRLDDAQPLVEFCAGLPWLVTREDGVFPDVRPLLLPLGRLYRLTAQVTPSGSAKHLWLHGDELKEATSEIRTVPGTRLAVTADCPGTQRVHWVVAGDEPNLAITIDCDFDRAVHTDARGLWLSSPPEVAGQHAAEIARVLEASAAIVLSRGEGQYQLRRFVDGRPGRSVAFPVVHSDRQLVAALEQLLEEAPPASLAASAQPTPPSVGVDAVDDRGMLWAGVATTVVGVGAGVAGWILFRARAAKGEDLSGNTDEADDGAWKRARAPMLGVGIGGAAAAAGGAALISSAVPSRRLPWWLAGAFGAAGVGLVVGAAVDLAKADCGDAHCVLGKTRQDRGILLLASSAPFFSLLLTKAAREAFRKEPALQVAWMPTGAVLTGTW